MNCALDTDSQEALRSLIANGATPADLQAWLQRFTTSSLSSCPTANASSTSNNTTTNNYNNNDHIHTIISLADMFPSIQSPAMSDAPASLSKSLFPSTASQLGSGGGARDSPGTNRSNNNNYYQPQQHQQRLSSRLLHPSSSTSAQQQHGVSGDNPLECHDSPIRFGSDLMPRSPSSRHIDGMDPEDRQNISAVLGAYFSRPAVKARVAAGTASSFPSTPVGPFPTTISTTTTTTTTNTDTTASAASRSSNNNNRTDTFQLSATSNATTQRRRISVPHFSPSRGAESEFCYSCTGGGNGALGAGMLSLMDATTDDGDVSLSSLGPWCANRTGGGFGGGGGGRHSTLDVSFSGSEKGWTPSATHNHRGPPPVGTDAGPRFDRLSFRTSPLLAPIAVVKEYLSDMAIPFIFELDATEEVNDLCINSLLETYGDHLYVVLTINVLLRYHFISKFGIRVEKLLNFVEEAHSFFRSGNPFHHPVHAADIVLAAHQWIRQPTVCAHLSDEEVFAFLFAASVMRVGHCGVENRFLADVRHPFATLCSYGSPQQGATMALVLALMEKPRNAFLPPCTPPAATAAPGPGMSLRTFPSRPPQQHQPEAEYRWTHNDEEIFMEMIFELVMATDERNHHLLRQGLQRIRDDHFKAHGCLCKGGGMQATGSVSKDDVDEDDDDGVEITEVIIEGTTKASPADNINANTTQSSSSAPCSICCSYISESHVPAVLKAVLHLIDFSYLIRPYDIFLYGSLSYAAEAYRQSECQAWLAEVDGTFAAHNRSSGGTEVAGMISAPTSRSLAALWQMRQQESAASIASTPTVCGAPPGSSARSHTSSGWSGTNYNQPCYQSAAAVEADLMACKTWREGAMHASARTTLCTAGGKENNNNYPTHHHITALSRDISMDAALSSQTAVPLPQRPLQGYGRDIRVIGLAELYIPFVLELEPYLPPSWTTAALDNQRRFLEELPTAYEYDMVVERILYPTSAWHAEMYRVGHVAIARGISFPFLAKHMVVEPKWCFDAQGFESRVLQTILQPHLSWLHLRQGVDDSDVTCKNTKQQHQQQQQTNTNNNNNISDDGEEYVNINDDINNNNNNNMMMTTSAFVSDADRAGGGSDSGSSWPLQSTTA